MALYIVATPIGNLNDFSKRGIDTLKECDLILAEDTRQTIKLLNHFDIKNKMVAYHKFNENKASDGIVDKLKNGMNIALVSDAGTPCISDPGYILVKKARENGIEVLGIPGCSAVIDALSVSGLDTSSFVFYGFVPTENKEKKELFDEIKHSKVKIKVLYESPKRILKLMEYINNEMPGCKVCVCTELTKVHEKAYYGIVNDVYEKMSQDPSVLKGEYVVMIENEPVLDKDDVSIEAKLLNIMIDSKVSLKEAINLLNENDKKLSKKDIYNASLNLKNYLNK